MANKLVLDAYRCYSIKVNKNTLSVAWLIIIYSFFFKSL